MGRTQGSSVEVAIVGGGIIGASLAYQLVAAGASVGIVERGAIGGGASGAAAGVIGPPSSPNTPASTAQFLARSIHAYPRFIAEVEEITGGDVGWRECGEFTVAWTDEEAALLHRLADVHEGLGFHSEWCDPRSARDQEPVLPETIVGALHTREAGSVFPDRLTRTIANAAARRGVRLLEHTPALGIETTDGRASGVRLPEGTLPAEQVVLAAGVWTGSLGLPLGHALPITPVKGQMLAIANPPVMPRHLIHGPAGGYLVPRTDGTIAVGATIEHAGFDQRPTAASVARCLEIAQRLGPSVLGGEITAIWAGLRPSAADEQPVLGLVPGYQNLWLAAGHFRTGIQMAVATAELLSRSILAGEPDPDLAPFIPARFSPS